MTFPNTTPVVNVEIAEGGVYLHDDQAEPYTQMIAKLDHIALSTRESQAMHQVDAEGGVIVEWRKSRYSGSGGNCVEIRQDLAALRDSKNAGPALDVDVLRLLAMVKSR